MFSLKEKQHIAAEIERILLELNHPEMPNSCPRFSLHVAGKEDWSWADIAPNWTFKDVAPSVNPFNEISRDLHSKINVDKPISK